MNKTISLAAIAMVAVIMGMSSFAPSVMADDDEPTQTICHIKELGNGEMKFKQLDVSLESAAEHLADHPLDVDGGCF